MNSGNDRKYLLESQYRDGANLNARIELHARFSANPVTWQRWAFDQLEIPSHGRLLEAGCGPGTLWMANRDRIPAGWNIMLSDFSPGMLEEARQNLSAVDRCFEFAVFDAQDIPLPDASLDGVIANHMLYHVLDRPRAFSEIRRVLRPGGRLYAATNGLDHMRELNCLLQKVGLVLRSTAGPFTLENGMDQLSPWFAKVGVCQYEDYLDVTEVEPLINYVLSEPADSPSDSQLAEMRAIIQDQIRIRGACHITKSSGMFIAIKEADE